MIGILLAKMSDEEKRQWEDEHEQRINDPMRISFNILNQYARNQADKYEEAQKSKTVHDSPENNHNKNRI